MATNVGGIYYDVTLNTATMVDGQRKVQAELAKTNSTLSNFGGGLSKIASAITVMATALAALKLAELADEFRLLEARVNVAAGSVDSGSIAFQRLIEISRNTQTSLTGNIDVFNRLNQSLLQMGGTQNDTLRITDLLSKAIKVSGANAMDAKAAMLQFGQAMGSGKLQGDEFRSLMENAPYLMKKMADAIGVPIGALKALSTQGKLTADVVANALNKAASSIDADFKTFPQTIQGALQVAEDAAGLAALKFDELTGSTATMTGIVKGAGEVIEALGKQFGAANTEAGNLNRNDHVKLWADRSKLALSYLVDAFDIVSNTVQAITRRFEVLYQAGAFAAGKVADFAKSIGTDMSNGFKVNATPKGDYDAAQLAGQKMRDSWEQGAAGAGRGLVNPQLAAPSKLKSVVDPADAAKLAAKRLAAQAYYEGIVVDNQTALSKINQEEEKSLTENKRRAATDTANADIYAKARVAIHAKYAVERQQLEEKTTEAINDFNIAQTIDEAAKVEAIRVEAVRRADVAERAGTSTAGDAKLARDQANFAASQSMADLAERNTRARASTFLENTKSDEDKVFEVRDEAIRQAETSYRRGLSTFEEAEAAKTKAVQDAIANQQALEANRAQTKVNTLQSKASGGGATDQIALVQAQAQQALIAQEKAREADMQNAQIYADAMVEIERKKNEDIQNIRNAANVLALTSTSNAFGSIADAMRNAGAEQSGVYKVMFAAQKAFSIASAIVSIQAGLAQAAANPWPENLVAMASVAAATASIISTISGASYGGGRQYGGPVGAGSLYKVNETGAPEMFMGSNGSQYMMPNKSGSVVPANQVGGGGQGWTINVHNAPPGTTTTVDQQARTIEIAVARAKAEINNDITNNSGTTWQALRGATNVQSRGL